MHWLTLALESRLPTNQSAPESTPRRSRSRWLENEPQSGTFLFSRPMRTFSADPHCLPLKCCARRYLATDLSPRIEKGVLAGQHHSTVSNRRIVMTCQMQYPVQDQE